MTFAWTSPGSLTLEPSEPPRPHRRPEGEPCPSIPTDPARSASTQATPTELVEMLTFLGDWPDRPALDASLHRFAHAAYGINDLQADLARFAFLLGDDGGRLVGHFP